MMCCSSCSIAEVDDIKLKKCAARVISLDIAAINVRQSICLNMSERTKNGRQNYVMRFYLDSLKSAILATCPIRFAFCLFQ
eukprot:scaffold7568_cov78-Skeletonema_marinoi.AAC.2